MPISYSTPTKNARLQAVVDAIGVSGLIVIGTSALAGGGTGVLASVPLDNPSFTIAGGVMTLAGTPRTVNASATGVAAKAELRTSGGVVIADGLTVGTAGTDFIINATAISIGQVVQVTAGSITHAA
jgi:hypothetical protein